MKGFNLLECVVAVLLLGVGVQEAEARKRWSPPNKSTYVQPQDRGGSSGLVVVDVEDANGRGREVDPEIACKVDMDVARMAWHKAVADWNKCQKDKDRYLAIQVGRPEAVQHAATMCEEPDYAKPVCEECAESTACKTKLMSAKGWRACRQEKIREGQWAGATSEAIDSEITNKCGPQIKPEAAYALLPGGASKVAAARQPQLMNRPGAPAAVKAPQPPKPVFVKPAKRSSPKPADCKPDAAGQTPNT